MSPRADRRRNDERVLLAAGRVLALDPGAGVQAVADAAGVARLTVYRRYPDRAALVSALREAVDAELDQALDALPPWGGGTATLVDLVGALAGVAVRYPVALLRYGAGADSPPAADRRVAEVLAAGQQAGVVRRDLGADVLNAALFGVLAAVLDTEQHRQHQPDQGLDPQAVARTVVALVLPGLATSTAPDTVGQHPTATRSRS